MIDPHGGALVDLLTRAEKRDELIKEAGSLDSVSLTPRQAADLERHLRQVLVGAVDRVARLEPDHGLPASLSKGGP